MRNLHPVLWSKGTLLTPQHLQLQDLYIESLLQFQLESLTNHLWGFTRLEIDEKKLEKGEFSISRAGGIFPDGLLFDLPGAANADVIPSLAIHGFFNQERTKASIYLSVPEHQECGQNVDVQRDKETRFVSTIYMAKDENSDSAAKPIQIAHKNFRLVVADKSPQGSTALKVAEVQRNSSGTYSLAAGFVPSMLDIHRNATLNGIAQSLLDKLSARSALLAATRRQRNQSLAEFSASDIARFWLLYTINHHLPIFRHFLQRKVVHPEQFFSTMLSLAGTLTTFSYSITPGELPQYDHDQLGPCFLKLEQCIEELLKTVIPVNYFSIPLRMARPSVYLGAIEDDRLLRDHKFFLAISADVSDADLIQRVLAVVKAGAASDVEEMIGRALSGLKLTYDPNPPSEIPVQLKYKYFKVELSGNAWEGVQRARDFGVYVPADLPNAQLELVAVPIAAVQSAAIGG